MRFTNKTFLQYKDEFLQNFSSDNEYVIYGVGENFLYVKELFKNELKIAYCIDKKANEMMDCEFITYLPDYLKLHPLGKKKIIIMPTSGMYDEIRNYLQEIGIGREKYCSSQEILLMWGWFYHKNVYSVGVNCFLTTRCTLNCKACVQFTPYIKKKSDIKLCNIMNSIDNYFKNIDRVKDFILVGGETFLYKYLVDICQYISDNYSSRYNVLKIFSNGTVVLEDSILLKLKKIKKIEFFLSDYTPIVKSKSKIKEITEKLDEKNFKYVINRNFGQSENKFMWYDFGNPFEKKYNCMDDIKEIFARCVLTCNNLYDNKLFYCVPSCASYFGGIYSNLQNDDFLDLNYLIDKEEKKIECIKFQLGFIKKGYVSFCENCYGCGMVNGKLLPAGEQA